MFGPFVWLGAESYLHKDIMAAVSKRKVRPSKVNLRAYPKNTILDRLYLWFAGRHWVILGVVGLVLFFLEAYDFNRYHGDITHIFEFVIYLSLLFVVGLLIDLLMTEIRIQTQTKEILDFKHKISLEFSKYHEWDNLVKHIARFPSRIAPVGRSCLLVSDALSGQLASVAQWNCTQEEMAELCAPEFCQGCPATDPEDEDTFYTCESDAPAGATKPGPQKYCLTFRYGGRILGILPFLLEPEATLTDVQMELFENIGDEIANALQAGQDRRAFLEMRRSETALAERREFSHYLHDHLGQNLGYLHIKMDQLIMERQNLSSEKVFADLEQMQEAVNESYEIVRGILERIHSETSPSLTNLLMEHARKISQRSNLSLDFKTKGQAATLPVEIQRAVFYAFEESLSNAEKHARATKVEVLAEWGEADFALTISDDGVGFDPQSVDTDQHFGMEILNERMAKVNGHVTVTTSENSGTVVSIQVPNPGDGRVGGEL